MYVKGFGKIVVAGGERDAYLALSELCVSRAEMRKYGRHGRSLERVSGKTLGATEALVSDRGLSGLAAMLEGKFIVLGSWSWSDLQLTTEGSGGDFRNNETVFISILEGISKI